MKVGSRWETDKLPVALLSTVKDREADPECRSHSDRQNQDLFLI